MPKVLVLGANGQLARNTIPFLLANHDVVLTLYLRHANRLANPDPSRVTIVEGDVLEALIEQSDLDYTILRPGWFTHEEAIDYQLTQKGEAFVGHDVSLNSLSDLIATLASSPVLYVRCSVGVSGK